MLHETPNDDANIDGYGDGIQDGVFLFCGSPSLFPFDTPQREREKSK